MFLGDDLAVRPQPETRARRRLTMAKLFGEPARQSKVSRLAQVDAIGRE